MTGASYTSVHNLISRGRVVPVEYVGVWTTLASHRDGWGVSERSLAAALGKGRAYIASALHALEDAGLLVRTQYRDHHGRHTGGTWYLTDLPARLRAEGITDRDEIAARVSAEHQLATTGQLVFPQAGPWSGYPATGEPAAGNPTTKKTNDLETQGEEHHPPTPAEPTPPVPSVAAGDGGGGDLLEETHTPPATQPATAPATRAATPVVSRPATGRPATGRPAGGRRRAVRTAPAPSRPRNAPSVPPAISPATGPATGPAAAPAGAVAPASATGRAGEPLAETAAAYAVLDQLPRPLPPALRTRLAGHVAACLAAGWTDTALLRTWTEDLPWSYRAGLLAYRVTNTPAQPPAPAAGAGHGAGHGGGLAPVCGQCDARYDSDPVSARVVWLDEDLTRSAPCPRCHPRARAGHAA